MARRTTDDPYVYPGTFTLKNTLGLTDPALLRIAEYAITQLRERDAPSFPMTPDGYKATHRHLFGDVFSWAGQTRTVGLTHPKHEMPFANPQFVEGTLAKQFRDLGRKAHRRKTAR